MIDSKVLVYGLNNQFFHTLENNQELNDNKKKQFNMNKVYSEYVDLCLFTNFKYFKSNSKDLIIYPDYDNTVIGNSRVKVVPYEVLNELILVDQVYVDSKDAEKNFFKIFEGVPENEVNTEMEKIKSDHAKRYNKVKNTSYPQEIRELYLGLIASFSEAISRFSKKISDDITGLGSDPMFLKQDPEKAHIDESVESTRKIESNEFGTVETWTTPDGKLHREDGPARIEKPKDGSYMEVWYQQNKIHRDDGPAEIRRYSDGTTLEKWCQENKIHRDDGPAIIRKYPDGAIEEKWFKEGYIHRDDGPARIEKSKDGSYMEVWYQQSEIHRDDGPATIRKFQDGTIEEKWFKKGYIHRDDGPAIITKYPNGRIEQKWYQYGLEVDKDELHPFKDDPMFQKSDSPYLDEETQKMIIDIESELK